MSSAAATAVTAHAVIAMSDALDLLVLGLATNAYIWIGVVFLFSLLIGSFLNVVIHRVPIMLEREWRSQAEEILREKQGDVGQQRDPQTKPPAQQKYNLVVPRSGCPKCGAMITAAQNIPLISYLLLKGKCAKCGAPISARYPIVELGTAILSALVAWKFGFVWYTAAALVLTWVLIALTGIDIDHQLLPDNMTLPLVWLGLLLSLAATIPEIGLPVDPRSSIIGAVAGYLSLWSVYHAFRLLTGKEGMGYGDFKLFAALGAWLGWKMLLPIILLAALTGAVLGILMITLRGRDRSIPIPFGPYLAAAGWIALLWGDQIVTSYLRFAGVSSVR
jgi:leader peptidase (prepilin peptidase)/N-methyltransferase